MKTPGISIGISENALAALHASTAQIRKLFLPNKDLDCLPFCGKVYTGKPAPVNSPGAGFGHNVKGAFAYEDG